MKIKGAIFDLDGTILDSMGIWNELAKRYLSSLGIKAEDNLADILFDLTIEEGCCYLREHYNLPFSNDEINNSLMEILADFYKNEVEPKPYVRELLDFLHEKNIPMAIASSSDKLLIKASLDRLDLSKYFSHILSCEELGVSKREPTIYNLSSKLLGSSPNETLVLEDTLFTVKTAKSSGYVVIAIRDDESISQSDEISSLADFYAEDFRKALEFLSSNLSF